MNKQKAISLIALSSFIFLIIGLLIGALIQQRHCEFWNSLIDQDNMERIQKLTEQNEQLIQHLIMMKQAIEDYVQPRDMDILRPSREE